MMTGISGRGRSGRGLALRRRTPMGDARYDALLSVDDRHILGIDSQDVESLLIDVMNLGDSAIRGSSRDTGIARREQENAPSLRPANLGASCGGTCRHRSLHDGDRSDHGRIAYGAPCDQHRATHCERPNFEHERAPLSWLMVFAAESPRARQPSVRRGVRAQALIQDHDLHLGVCCDPMRSRYSRPEAIAETTNAPWDNRSTPFGRLARFGQHLGTGPAASVEASLNSRITARFSGPQEPLRN